MDLKERTNQLLADKVELVAYWEALLPDLPVPPHFQWMVWLVRHKFPKGIIQQGIDSLLTVLGKKPDLDAAGAVRYASGTMHKLNRRKQ